VTRACASEDLAPIEIGQDCHDVLATRAGGIAQGGRRQRGALRQAEREGLELVVRRGGVGEVVIEDHDPAGAFELADPVGRTPGRAGGLAQGRRRGRGEDTLESLHRGDHRGIRGRCFADLRTGERDPVSVTLEPAVRHEPVDQVGCGCLGLIASDRHEPAQSSGGAGSYFPESQRPFLPWPVVTEGAQDLAHARVGNIIGETDPTARPTHRPVKIETRSGHARRDTGVDRLGQASNALPCLAPPRDAANRDRVEDGPADRSGARGDTKDQAVAFGGGHGSGQSQDRDDRPAQQLDGVASRSSDDPVS
jgi:hypothetical protein